MDARPSPANLATSPAILLRPLPSPRTSTPWAFEWSGRDEALQNIMHARFYGASLGRFMRPDDGSDQHPDNPQSWNLYSYVRGNPVNMSDPTGHGAWVDFWHGVANTVEQAGNAVSNLGDQANQGGVVGTAVDATLGTVGDMVAGSGDMFRVGDATGEAIGNGASGEDLLRATSQDAGRAGALALTMALPAKAAGVGEPPPTTVIGKLPDLNKPGAIKAGEKTLEASLPDKGSPKANWKQNSGVLREEMGKGQPIRDASVNPKTGALRDNTGFLGAERNLLQNKGWTYDPKSTMWNPPN